MWKDALGVLAALAMGAAACEGDPATSVVIADDFAASHRPAYVVYRARWQAVLVDAAVLPGAASAPLGSVPASDNTAYVIVAPGWSPASDAAPTEMFVMESKSGYAVGLNGALQIAVDDASFVGDCAARSFLSQEEADFITQIVFPTEFAGLRYDAATCKTSPLGGAITR